MRGLFSYGQWGHRVTDYAYHFRDSSQSGQSSATSGGTGASRGVSIASSGGRGVGRGYGGRGSDKGGHGPTALSGRIINNASVYHIAGQAAHASNAMVTSTLSVAGYSTYFLFDSGATHSFITLYFTRHMGLVAYPLKELLEVSSSLGNKIIIDFVVR